MANQRLNAVITIGGTVTGALKSALGTTQTKLRAIGGTIRDLEREQKTLNREIKGAADIGAPIRHLESQYGAVTRQIERARIEQQKFKRALEGRNTGKAMMGEALGTIGAVGAVVATAGLPVIHAASFEKAMLGVAKQVDGARDASGRLTHVYHDMAREIQRLGREVPIATNELAGMVEQGARMGIARENLIDFTRTAAKMATALDLPREELADDMGKIANLYKMPVPAIEGLGDAINYLDDNALSKGGDIIQFLSRTGGVAGAVKVSATEMAALGSTLLSLGERTETASTASNAFIQKLAAADKGTKKFRRAMDEIGLSTAAVQKGMQVDAQGTILRVVDAVRKLPKEKQLGVLVDLIGLEHSDTLAKLVSGVEEYRKQIALVGSEKVAGSMSREFAAQLGTTSAQWEILKNRAFEASVNIGTVLLPAVNKVAGVVGSVAAATADWVRENGALVKNTTLVIGAVIGGVAAINAFKFAIGAVPFAFNTLSMAIAANPIGAAAIAIGAAAVLIYENWEPISAFFKGLWAGVTDAAGKAWNWLKGSFLTFSPLGIVIKNWEPIGRFLGDLWAIVKDGAAIAWNWIKTEFLGAAPVKFVVANWEPVRNFFGAIWSGVKAGAGALWGWLKDSFLSWTPLGLVVKNWEPIKAFFGNLWNGLKSSAMGFLDWVIGKISGIGDAVHKLRVFMDGKAAKISVAGNEGRGKPGAPRTPPPAPRTPPPAPPMAKRHAAANVTTHNTNTFHITQQPGQDADALAAAVIKKIDARDRNRRGGQLYDRAAG